MCCWFAGAGAAFPIPWPSPGGGPAGLGQAGCGACAVVRLGGLLRALLPLEHLPHSPRQRPRDQLLRHEPGRVGGEQPRGAGRGGLFDDGVSENAEHLSAVLHTMLREAAIPAADDAADAAWSITPLMTSAPMP